MKPLLLLLPLLLACSSSAPLEPAPSDSLLAPVSTDVEMIAARNTTEMNLGRMLMQNEGHSGSTPTKAERDRQPGETSASGSGDTRPVPLADLTHTCPVWGICWYCYGEQRDSTHTRPPQQDYGTIYNTINFGMPGMGAWTE